RALRQLASGLSGHRGRGREVQHPAGRQRPSVRRGDEPTHGLRAPPVTAARASGGSGEPMGPIEQALDAFPNVGDEMMSLAQALFPLPRSLTGDGVRETLRMIGEWVPLELTEVASGTGVFDWTVPPEWSLREAWIRDSAGDVVVDGRETS